jgi:hypothetical protein
MKTGLLVLGCLALASLSAGCTSAEFCEPLKKCGGDFLAAGKGDWGGDGVVRAEWVVAAPASPSTAASNSCVDQVQNPTQPPSLAKIPARPAGVRAVEPTTLNWCADLRFSADGNISVFDDGWYETLIRYRGWFPGIPLYTARLTIDEGGQQHYEMQTTQLVAQHYELPKTCMYAQGVAVACGDFAKGLDAYVTDRLMGLSKVGVAAEIYGTTCKDQAGGDGCVCDYNLALTATTTGPYAVDYKKLPGEIAFFDSAASPPSGTEYCAQGSRLELTGHNGADLFNRTALKTLQFGPATCDDGVQSKSLGETGIDCGGSCGACQ